MEEIWKDIKGYEGLYQVSNMGRVRRTQFINIHTNRKQIRIKEPKLTYQNYYEVALYKNCKPKYLRVHRLVAEAFIPNEQNKPYINHKNGDKSDNNIENLEWVTASENTQHSINILKKGITAVNQYDLNGNYINTFESIVKASAQTGTSKSGISNVIAGRRNKANNFLWSYAYEKI